MIALSGNQTTRSMCFFHKGSHLQVDSRFSTASHAAADCSDLGREEGRAAVTPQQIPHYPPLDFRRADKACELRPDDFLPEGHRFLAQAGNPENPLSAQDHSRTAHIACMLAVETPCARNLSCPDPWTVSRR